MTSDNQTEIWRPVNIDAFRDAYEVSNMGRVRRSRPGPGTIAGKVLKQYDNGRGYLGVSLTARIDGVVRQKRWYTHHLVLRTFVSDPPDEKHQCAHQNGNREDNRASNLRWSTCSDNMADKLFHGTMSISEQHHMTKIEEADLPIIRWLRLAGLSFVEIGEIYGLHEYTISAIARKRTWRYSKA